MQLKKSHNPQMLQIQRLLNLEKKYHLLQGFQDTAQEAGCLVTGGQTVLIITTTTMMMTTQMMIQMLMIQMVTIQTMITTMMMILMIQMMLTIDTYFTLQVLNPWVTIGGVASSVCSR